MTKHLKGCTRYQKSGRLSDTESASFFNCQSVMKLLNSKKSNSNHVMKRDCLKEKVLRIIVLSNMSLFFADNTELWALLKNAYSNCSLPNRKSAHEYLQLRFYATVADIKAKLVANESKINLVLNAWTTRSNLSFLDTSLFSVTEYRCLLLIIFSHPVTFRYVM